MMWRGAVFSSLLHGGLLIGLVGSLPILPRIFDRSVEPDPTELQIPVDVVDTAALKQLADVPGLRDAAPDSETAAPAPRPLIGLLPPRPVPQRPGTAPPRTETPLRVPPAPTAAPAVPIPVPGTTAPRSPRVAPATSAPLSRDGQTSPPGRPSSDSARTAVAEVSPSTDRTTPPTSGSGNTGTVDAGETKTEKNEARNATAQNEFVRALSGRKRDLVVDLLAGDARTRRAVTPPADDSNIPEQARTRTLDRLTRAANAGFSHAQYNLAGKYLRGEDVPKDLGTAQKWLTRAAEQGYAPAQSLLALMRFTGKGAERDGEPDAAEAAFWWSLAAEAGNPGAKLATERLRPLLKPQEHVRSQRLRARWGSIITDLADLASGEQSRRDINRALQEAAEKGDLDAVLSLLARGADADQSGDAGRNAVINAAWRGRHRIIQLLLERGVATELPDDDGRTALMWAAINGHDSIVTELVASGANPNKRDRDGGTALIRAAWNGHASVVSRLIAAGADVNIRDDNGLSAMAHARREGNTAVIQLLERAGAR